MTISWFVCVKWAIGLLCSFIKFILLTTVIYDERCKISSQLYGDFEIYACYVDIEKESYCTWEIRGCVLYFERGWLLGNGQLKVR